ncbi:MAG: YfaP family protein, partial [Armatimonadota bacterium]
LDRSETNTEGQVCFDDLASRQYALTTAADGLATNHRIVEVPDEGGEVTVTLDEPVEQSPTECPVVNLDDPAETLDEDAGTATLSGTVGNADSNRIVVFHNGEPTVVSIDADGSFTQLFFLTPGVNTFQVLVGNAACTIVHPQEPLEVDWTPPEGGDFVFRVTLSWDGETDADLHTWAPDLDEHSSYQNLSISGGQLDIDDTAGFGPENFTATEIQEGRWRIAINSYSIRDVGSYDVNVRVVTGGLAANTLSRTFGPHTFTSSNSGDDPVEPPSWWRPVDIVVAADGTVSVESPDETTLPAGVSAADSGSIK